MYSDRRHQPRKVPKGFAFIQVERDDGGRVLNISESGLCFEVFSTLRATQTLRFWFTFDLRDRIEALGRLVWMDATKGIGGLSFTGLSQSARDRIHAWIGNLPSEEENQENQPLAPPQVLREPVTRFIEAEPVKPLEWPVPSLETIPFNRVATLSSTGPAPEAAPEYPSATELVPLARHRSAKRLQFVRGLVVGIALSSAVAAPILRYTFGASHPVGYPETSAEAAVGTPEAQTQTASQILQPKSPMTTASFAPSYPVKSQHLVASDGSSGNAFAAPAAKLGAAALAAASHAAQPSDSAISNRAAAARKTPATPTQLWAQVHAGSSKAAVELAELYIHGNGVPLNCDQARILLLVASEKNNKEAIQRLRDLDKTGCPLPQS